MDSLLENILSLLENDPRPTGEFARAIGIPPSSVSDWRAKKSRSYTKYLPKIANYFSVSIDMLFNGYASAYSEDTLQPCKLPIISHIPQFGAPVTADNITGFDFAHLRFPNEYFFFRPHNAEDTLYTIHRQNYADDGDTVLIRGEDAPLICSYNTHSENVILTPNNTDAPPMCFTEGQSREIIIGAVTEIRKKLKF